MNAELQAAFADYDRQVRITNSKLGAVLAMILMPAGVALDYFVYQEKLWPFLGLRLLCSAGVAVVWGLFHTEFGKRHYRVLGMTWYMLPAFFIAVMIYQADDPFALYYAGLNIVLLGVGLILPWTYQENLLAALLVILMYLGATWLQSIDFSGRILFNNLYFLVLTAIVVVAGSYFHSKLRFNEFALRFELDKTKRLVEETNQKLVEMDQVKSRFFANISHELRTPLTLLLAPLQSILTQKNTAFDSQSLEWLNMMHANGMRLLKLINDLLDLVKLESGNIEVLREPLNLPEFIRGVCNSVMPVAQDKRLRLYADISPEISAVLADRDKLEKILLNLVFNALKFTPAGGSVQVKASRVEDQLSIEVIDTGVGIAEEQLPHVFRRFWQADSSARRKFQGTGIGLALVKELTEAQGGTIAVQSKTGLGTTMTVRLPYLATEAASSEPAVIEPPVEQVEFAKTEDVSAKQQQEWLTALYRRAELFPSMTSLQETLRPEDSSGGSDQPKLLIADDEPDMLRFLKSQLQGHYRVYESVDGLQALEKAAQYQPDIILLDMMMPEMDGLQVCRELRNRTLTESIPVILLTARADEETKISALSAGANDFLSKPFSTTELHVRVKNLVDIQLSRKRVARQNQVLQGTLDQLKDTEIQLVQSEKLASLGRLSAGIIHEINNPLNYARTGLFALRNKGKLLPEGETVEFEEILKDIEDGVNRVKTIVTDLRTFTHPDTENISEVNIADSVKSALRFMAHDLRENIKVVEEVDPELTIPVNKNQFIQVLVNLFQNSVDSLKQNSFSNGAGELLIKTERTPTKRKIIIRDNGKGIPEEQMGKIFDPFFTTKEIGQGMGLGLSICYRIINQYGGAIKVKSQPGEYAEFTLEFPEKSA